MLKTSGDVALDHGWQMDNESVGVSMINDDSSTRFSTLDSEKYGKTLLSPGIESAETLLARDHCQWERIFVTTSKSIRRMYTH